MRQRVREGGHVGPVKTGRSLRQVPMPDFLTDLVRVLLDTHDHSFVFPNTQGGPLHYRNFMNRVWYPLQRNAEVSVLGFHATRHFYASRLIEQGANLKELQVLTQASVFSMSQLFAASVVQRVESKAEARRYLIGDLPNTYAPDHPPLGSLINKLAENLTALGGPDVWLSV